MIKILIFLFSISLLTTSCISNADKEELAMGADKLTQSGEDNASEEQPLQIASNESFSTSEDTKLIIPAIQITQQWDERKIYDPTNGVVIFNGETLEYDAFLDYHGEDNIKLEYIKDGNVVFTRNILITVISVNDAPLAADDTAVVAAQTEILINVLGNDVDVDTEDELIITAIDPASNGTASIENGKIKYTSDAQFNGSETLNYTIEDKAGLSSQATLTITVSYSTPPPPPANSVPVRLAFIEHSDGRKLTEDYAAYAANVVAKLNETYTDGTDKKLNFVLDSHTSIVNDTYFETASNAISSALAYFRTNYNTNGKVNIYFVKTIIGGVAGVAYVNQAGTTTGMFEKMATAALEKNVVGHEIGHNVGFYHTADQTISEPRYIGYKYSSCNLDTFYYQHDTVSYPPGDVNFDGWHYGANLMYPIASPNPSSLFTGKYDVAFSDIMSCWHQRSGWP